jgi:hypothetical protein
MKKLVKRVTLKDLERDLERVANGEWQRMPRELGADMAASIVRDRPETGKAAEVRVGRRQDSGSFAPVSRPPRIPL